MCWKAARPCWKNCGLSCNKEKQCVNSSLHEAMVEQMFHGGATAKGALIITPEKVIVTTPGADNKKEL